MTTWPVWSYWEGPKPIWIEMCLETMREHIPQLTIYNRETWEADRRSIEENWDIPLDPLSPNHRADYIRVALLARHGGIWMDADTLVMRPPHPLYALMDTDVDLICPRDDSGYLLPGLMGAKPSPDITVLYESMARRLRAGEQFSWCGLLVAPLTEVADFSPRAKEIPIHEVWPLQTTIEDMAQLFVVGNNAEHEQHYRDLCPFYDPYLWILAHEVVRKLGDPGDNPDTFFSWLYKRSLSQRRQ